ncbi:Lreu_0056 family protein [Ligilactobacillus aviarius]|uniref:Lreu_0056 family protein n=1 Tax=Ligilactobacillus aviarius TaxID=1606 RepID=UPI00195F0CA2|nr:hypothetical protein [Ligilactobacillus aviarius]MBM6863035.1 hypothetical protein [Ligilactobacillus aviarius]
MKKELIIGTIFLGCSAILAGCGNTTHSTKAVTHPQTVRQNIQKQNSTQPQTPSSAANQNSVTNDPSSNSQSDGLSYDARHLSVQQLGTLICLLKDPDEFKDADNGQPGVLYYGTVPQGSDYGQQFWGMNFLTTNGDPTSYLYFKPDGPNVIIRYVDDDGTTGVANAPVKTESISIQRLVNDYYISQDQKNEVNGYVNRIQPEQKWFDRYNLNSSSTDNN